MGEGAGPKTLRGFRVAVKRFWRGGKDEGLVDYLNLYGRRFSMEVAPLDRLGCGEVSRGEKIL